MGREDEISMKLRSLYMCEKCHKLLCCMNDKTRFLDRCRHLEKFFETVRTRKQDKHQFRKII